MRAFEPRADFNVTVAQRTACDRCALVTSISPATVSVLSVDPTTRALTAVGAGIQARRLGVAFLALTHGPFDQADGHQSQGACEGFPSR
jgi:hypothetical protein